MENRLFMVGVIVGILATVTMDAVAVIALRLGIAGRGPRRTGPDLIGRWIGYLLKGKFKHTDILQARPCEASYSWESPRTIRSASY
jgi:hypothetical protein